MDGEQLRYWYGDERGASNTADLLLQMNGDCESWATFFVNMLKTQSISARLYQVLEKSHPGKFGFLVKEMTFLGEGSSPETAPYVYIGARKVHEENDVIDTPNENKGKAQGNDDPPAPFFNHYIVKVQSQNLYYDPSYGTGPFYKEQWENLSLDGFFYDDILYPDGSRSILAKRNEVNVHEVKITWWLW